jgi:hypothetical protein
MSEFKNMENELDPRLQQMLEAYGVAPERDPESARRNQERFVAILNMIFDERAPSQPAVGWFTLPAWPSSFNHLKESFARSVGKRSILVVLILLIGFATFLFGGVGITAYAASSSLPGDALFSLKTTLESARAELTADSAAQARLYMEFAGRRLSETQSLISEGRYGDIPQAASEFEGDIQKAVSAIESLSQTDPARAVALSAEIAAILRGYSDILLQMVVDIPGDTQPVIQSAVRASQSAAGLLDVNYDDFNDDDDNEGTPSPQASNTPQPPDTSQPSPEAIATLQITEISTPLSAATEPPQATATPIPFATQAGSGADPVIPGGDGTCQGFLGAVTVENLTVPQGASCTLDRTRVQGNIKVENGASLTARQVTVIGNIQADGASFVEVLAGATVGGSIQLKQGGSARIENVIVNGDIQFESNNGVLSAAGNQVGGNIQVFQNVGGVTIAHNAVNGNLQCKENNPAPGGGSNTVQGNKEDQCAGL